MAEPVRIRKPFSSETELRDLCKKIEDPTKEFIQSIRKVQADPGLMDQSIYLGHFANNIIALNEATKVAKNLD